MGPGLTRVIGPCGPGCAVEAPISMWIPYQNVAGVKLIDPKGTITAKKAKITTTNGIVPTRGTTKGTTIKVRGSRGGRLKPDK